MDELFQAASTLVEGLLHKHAQFVPVVIQLDYDGRQKVATAEGDSTRDMHDLIYAGLRSNASSLRCVAVATDVSVGGPEPTDAIRVHVEHREGPSISIYTRYLIKRRLWKREIQFGPVNAAPDERRVWGWQDDA